MRTPIIRRREELETFEASDGALVSEYFGRKDGIRNIGVAVGGLGRDREAIHHYHKKCDEIYIVLSGSGIIHLGNQAYPIGSGDQVFIPRGVKHALETTEGSIEIACISAPAFDEGDFLIAKEVSTSLS